ncbi:MAG: phenylalanine--tRNA ligase subunit beta [Campylobacter sp.]|nr:phenylalanine--tRNA ligase subunit beta [Campylobacter sp.]
MIISKNWLNEYIDLSAISGEQILKTLNSIGLEVDSYKEIKIPDSIVVGYVKSREKHPNADKLSVCEVDIGTEVLQIVCGAPNVAAGLFVPVALLGTKMPNGLEIKKAKLRGVESCGMICSSVELGLAKINDGIMPLDNSIGELSLGRSLSDFEVFNDVVIEVDITANRGDAQSIYGIARELSVAFDLNFKEKPEYREVDNLPGIGRLISLRTDENIKSSFLYKAIAIKSYLGENLFTKLRLALAECDKKNSLERLLYYVTYSSGVLFRAYDFDKLAKVGEKANFDIKVGENGESIVMVKDKILSVAGIYQNDDAKVDDDTKIAIIEASFSDPKIISEASALDKQMPRDEHLYRSSRGSEPQLGLGMGLLFRKINLLDEISPYAGDSKHALKSEQIMLNFNVADINKMIGQNIDKNEILRILKKLGFEVVFNQVAEIFNVKAPIYRHDIVNLHDVCEEIVRIVGIDNIHAKAMKFSETNRINDTYETYKFALKLRQRAVGAGYFESVHYVFDNSSELANMGFKKCKVEVTNPLSAELDSLRPSLVNHLLNSTERNIKNSKKSVKLFEYGAVFDQDGEQSSNLGFVASGLRYEPSLLNGAKVADIDFFAFANSIQSVIGEFTLKPSDQICYLNPYEQAKIYQNGKCVGYIGGLHQNVQSQRDLPKTYLCEIYFDKLERENKIANVYSKFPSIGRDLSLIVPDGLEFVKIAECIKGLKLKELKEFAPVDIYRSAELGKNASISVKFVFQDDEKTLEDADVAEYMDKILKALKSDLDIGIR